MKFSFFFEYHYDDGNSSDEKHRNVSSFIIIFNWLVDVLTGFCCVCVCVRVCAIKFSKESVKFFASKTQKLPFFFFCFYWKGFRAQTICFLWARNEIVFVGGRESIWTLVVLKMDKYIFSGNIWRCCHAMRYFQIMRISKYFTSNRWICPARKQKCVLTVKEATLIKSFCLS